MSRRTARDLTLEDRILWGRVASSATPLPGKRFEAPEEPAARPEAAEGLVTRPDTAVAAAERNRPVSDSGRPTAIDRHTREKLSKGRLALEAKVDLHGLTQAEAHGLLLSFLNRAHLAGIRHVLVITGKGASMGSEGVLKRAVPSWFSTAPFRPLVGGYEQAGRRHGGDGAFYVRLRRREPGEHR